MIGIRPLQDIFIYNILHIYLQNYNIYNIIHCNFKSSKEKKEENELKLKIITIIFRGATKITFINDIQNSTTSAKFLANNVSRLAKRETGNANDRTRMFQCLRLYNEGSQTDRVLQANSVCNLTRRGFLVREVYVEARNVSLGHPTVKLKLELELELVLVVPAEPRGLRVPLFPILPASPLRK